MLIVAGVSAGYRFSARRTQDAKVIFSCAGRAAHDGFRWPAAARARTGARGTVGAVSAGEADMLAGGRCGVQPQDIEDRCLKTSSDSAGCYLSGCWPGEPGATTKVATARAIVPQPVR